MSEAKALVTGATGTVSTALLAELKGTPGIHLRAFVHNSARVEALVEEGSIVQAVRDRRRGRFGGSHVAAAHV
jgi:uncharacterized protein YbjT (DUF2867 family)